MPNAHDVLFRTLADPTRRALFERLCREGERTVGALTARAGVSAGMSLAPGSAVRIMTGAPVPHVADSVVRVEDTDGGTAVVAIYSARDALRNVRPRGEDIAEGAIAAARRLPELDRRRCRDAFERNFTASRMANDYVRLYERLARARQTKEPA